MPAIVHAFSNTIADWTGTVTVGNESAGTQTVAASALMRPSDWNSAHNQLISNYGNTAGQSTASGTNVVWAGAGGLSLSASQGASVATVSFVVPTVSTLVGSRGITISSAGSTVSIQQRALSYFAAPDYHYSTQTQTVAVSTSAVWPMLVNEPIEMSFARMIQTVSQASMASIATAANNTKTYSQQATFNFVMYARGIGASSMSLQSAYSMSATSGMSIAVGQNAQGSQWTVTHAFSFPHQTTAQATSSTSYATTLSNVNISTTHLTAISGIKAIAFPWTTTVDPGQYWMCHGFSTAHTTNGNASLSNMRVTASHWGLPQANNTYGEFGSANAASIQGLYGVGSFSTAGGGTTASMDFSNISSSASHVVPFMTLGRIA